MPPRQSKQTDDLGELLKLLSHPHRRRIITRLHDRNPRNEDEFDLEELAGDDELENETIALIHNHLPKLAEAGFINWDQEQRTVTRGPRFEEIAPLIDLMVNHKDELPATGSNQPNSGRWVISASGCNPTERWRAMIRKKHNQRVKRWCMRLLSRRTFNQKN